MSLGDLAGRLTRVTTVEEGVIYFQGLCCRYSQDTCSSAITKAVEICEINAKKENADPLHLDQPWHSSIWTFCILSGSTIDTGPYAGSVVLDGLLKAVSSSAKKIAYKYPNKVISPYFRPLFEQYTCVAQDYLTRSCPLESHIVGLTRPSPLLPPQALQTPTPQFDGLKGSPWFPSSPSDCLPYFENAQITRGVIRLLRYLLSLKKFNKSMRRLMIDVAWSPALVPPSCATKSETILEDELDYGIVESKPSRSKSHTDKSRSLYVSFRNKAPSEDLLKKRFESMGTVTNVYLPVNGEGYSMGYAFVEMKERKDIPRIAKVLSNKKVDGIPIIVRPVEESKTKKSDSLPVLPENYGGFVPPPLVYVCLNMCFQMLELQDAKKQEYDSNLVHRVKAVLAATRERIPKPSWSIFSSDILIRVISLSSTYDEKADIFDKKKISAQGLGSYAERIRGTALYRHHFKAVMLFCKTLGGGVLELGEHRSRFFLHLCQQSPTVTLSVADAFAVTFPDILSANDLESFFGSHPPPSTSSTLLFTLLDTVPRLLIKAAPKPSSGSRDSYKRERNTSTTNLLATLDTPSTRPAKARKIV